MIGGREDGNERRRGGDTREGDARGLDKDKDKAEGRSMGGNECKEKKKGGERVRTRVSFTGNGIDDKLVEEGTAWVGEEEIRTED